MEIGSSSPSVLPLFITTGSPYSAYGGSRGSGNTTGNDAVRTWVANLVSYCPIWLPVAYPVKRIVMVNGTTVTSTHVDFGIMGADGTRIYNTGSTVMTANVQYITPAADFILSPGMYYFAWTCDGTTSRGRTFGGSANTSRIMGLCEETTGTFGIPATMTPVAFARAWGASLCGVTRTSSGF